MNKKYLRNKDRKIFRTSEFTLDRSETREKLCNATRETLSNASTTDELRTPISVTDLATKKSHIPTPKPILVKGLERKRKFTLEPGNIVTYSLPAEVYSTPSLFIRYNVLDYELDIKDKYGLENLCKKLAIDEKEVLHFMKAYEWLVNLYEKWLKIFMLRKNTSSTDNSGKTDKPSMNMCNLPNVFPEYKSQVPPDLEDYVSRLVSPEMVNSVQAIYKQHVDVQTRHKYLIKFLNPKPGIDEKGANIAFRSRLKKQKPKWKTPKKAYENYLQSIKYIYDKIENYQEVMSLKAKREEKARQNFQLEYLSISLFWVGNKVDVGKEIYKDYYYNAQQHIETLRYKDQFPVEISKRKRSESVYIADDTYYNYSRTKEESNREMIDSVTNYVTDTMADTQSINQSQSIGELSVKPKGSSSGKLDLAKGSKERVKYFLSTAGEEVNNFVSSYN